MRPRSIILDTNVLSEMTRQEPSSRVTAWYLQQDSAALFTTTITVAEVLYGLDLMPRGKRRDHLLQLSQLIFQVGLQGKVLVFDEPAAIVYATLRSKRKLLGRPIGVLDAQIAAIALANGFTLATRNVTDFEHSGVPLVNPWLA